MNDFKIKKKMKHEIIYLLFALLLFSCSEEHHVQESFSEMNDFFVEKESAITTTTRSSSGPKDGFELNDEIHIYGYSKLTPGASTPAEGRNRFMPIADDVTPTIGAAYEFVSNQSGGWYRFYRDPSIDDGQLIGFWRTRQYHDFAAYYFEPKPTTPVLEFEMDSDGLLQNELLWGDTTDIYFSGEVQIIPRITFKHQLSRIRVEGVHDMNIPTSSNFEIDWLELGLDKQKASFDLETGKWSNILVSPLTLTAVPNTFLDEGNQLEPINIHEWWVLPGCTISDFKLNIKRGTLSETKEVSFQDFFDPDDTEPITKPGYITVLRLEFGDAKSIIFTVSLEPWDLYRPENPIVIDDDTLID